MTLLPRQMTQLQACLRQSQAFCASFSACFCQVSNPEVGGGLRDYWFHVALEEAGITVTEYDTLEERFPALCSEAEFVMQE